jgi:methyl-accepting chemotaxis protein
MIPKPTFKSIRAKLTTLMVGFVMLNVAALSYSGIRSMTAAVEDEATARLSGLANLQELQVERLLGAIDRDLRLQASHPFIADALTEFAQAFGRLDDPLRQLQGAYIDANPHPLGQKDLLVKSTAGLAYDEVHARHHPALDRLQDAMGYYDVFLFDTKGNVVYSVFKELDFATNVQSGQWRDSGLGEVYRQAIALGPDQPAVFVDFAPYAPSAGAAAAFIARPVFAANGVRLGVLAYQMPIDELSATIDNVLAELPESDAFLVSADGLLVTDTPRTPENDVLVTPFSGEALVRGLQGEEGVASYLDRKGEPVLGYYAPISFLGTDWVMIVDETEHGLFTEVRKSTKFQIAAGGAAFAAALVVAFFFSRGISLPLQQVTAAVGRVAGKDYATEVPSLERADEIGSIARSLDDFRQTLAAAEAGARDAAFKGAAFESTGAPMLLTNLDLKIVGANRAFFRMVNENQEDFGVAHELDHDWLIGRDLSDLSFPPAEIRDAVVDHKRLPIRKKVGVGNSYVGLLIDLVRSRDGTPIGYVLDMKNQTFQMLSQTVLDALDMQQTRIEFDFQRRVRLANKTGLSSLGLTEEAFVGRDGPSLVAPYDDGAEATDIWQEALEGRGTGGRFRVEAASGYRIIEGSFSPVPDQDGSTKGFLLIGGDVTEARQAFEASENARRAEAAELARVVDVLSGALARMAEGDLSAAIRTEFAEAYERLRNDFNAAAAKLGAAMQAVVENSGSIGHEAGGINASVAELSRRTEAQAATLEETTAAMTELVASVASSAREARDAAEVAVAAKDSAEASGRIVREAAGAMERIEASSQQVSKIIGVIDDIAFQTNLLALNAGVEAARAGDAGRGFAVVASEVRALAQRCLEASNEISALINSSGESVAKGVSLVGEAGAALERISASVLQISDNVAHIAEASGEQSGGLNEISSALVNLDQMTQHNAAMAEEATAAAQSLLREAEALNATTTLFTLPEDGSHGASERRAVA